MPNLKDMKPYEEPIKALFVGENGTGKSIAAASFYKLGPARIWDFDGRLKPIATYFPNPDISYESYTSDNFRSFLDELDSISSSCPYKTLILDSVTTSSVTCVVFQLKVKGLVKADKGGLPATSWAEINGETVLFTQMLELMKLIHKKHGVNIIWTAHPVPKIEITDSETKRLTSIAAYGNKIPALIPGYFDEIYNFEKVKGGLTEYKHIIHTVPKNGLPGKTAFPGKLPPDIDFTKKNFCEVLFELLKK